MKTTIEKLRKTVKFEFDVDCDWQPMQDTCWQECPFAVCTEIGSTCLALQEKLCPFKWGLDNEPNN